MSNLTNEQIDFIAKQVNKSNIDSKELKEDLIDHFCCLIEDDLKNGKNFEESSYKTFKTIFPDGFDKNHRKSIILLTSRNIKIMKAFLFSLCFITSIFLTTSFMFKALHWKGAGTLLVVASFLFIFVFTPLVFLYLYKRTFSKMVSHKLRYVIGTLGIIILLSGAAFKVFHWPGANILVALGILVINLLFLPLIFYGMYKRSISRKYLGKTNQKLFYLFGWLSTFLFLFANFFKMMHWPGSELLLITSICVLNIIFLPLLFIKLYKLSMN